MKVGETREVTIGSLVVAQAQITEIDTENQVVTVVIPATKAKLSYTTQLSEPPAPQAPEQVNDNAHVLLGTEQTAPGGEAKVEATGVNSVDPALGSAPSPAGVPAPSQVGSEAPVNSDGEAGPAVIPASPQEPASFDSPAHQAVQSGAVETTELPQGVLPGEDPSS